MADITLIDGTRLRGALRADESMARHVSWRAGGNAECFYQPADVADLGVFLGVLPSGEALLFVGLGSNLLIRDGGFAGTVIFTHHALTGISPGPATRGRLTFEAAAGVPAPHLARFVAKHGGAGAEWMAGVPGTIGGALAMNAGCYGGETWENVIAVTTIDRKGALHARSPVDYDIGYRHVEAHGRREEWYVSATFAFDRGDERAAMARVKELLQQRVASQPLNEPNAGSVFRNPPNDHAARLIESCGLKGFTIGGANVSTKHSNFIVNTNNATAADIEAVIDHVQKTVRERTGIDLVREVRIVGNKR